LEAIDKKVSVEMNQKLLPEFNIEEIATSMQQMPPLKAPGPDGFSACFYQSNCTTVQQDVCTTILHILNTGEMDALINTTYQYCTHPKGAKSGQRV